jgi:hypothetical protein
MGVGQSVFKADEAKKEIRMRYMCLVNMDPAITGSFTEADWKQFQQETRDFDDELIEAGKLVMASPLDEPRNALTFRTRKDSRMVTDGPFAETKEYIAGFIIFEAADRDEATAIAARCPFLRVGSVEIRALVEY